MKPLAHINHHFVKPEIRSSGTLSFWRFFLRYPIFLLAFGPPILRPTAGIDATKGIIDFWSVLQVVWIGAIGARAIYRLANEKSIQMPRQVRSVYRYVFLLGLLFLFSATYSPSRSVSAAYAFLYFLTMISFVEFIVDVYRNPPDWMQCLIHLRMVFFLLFLLVLAILPFFPTLIMVLIPGVGLRLGGGVVAPVTVICPAIALISLYTFLHALESKARSAFFFMVGIGGTFVTQSRGAEISLLASMMLVGLIWARSGRRNNYLFIASSFATILLSAAALAVIGGGRLWTLFNRGQSIQGIESASGRTDIWKFVLHYCMAHPMGMGYIAGFRVIFREYYTLGLQVDPTHIGNAHNTFLEVLADAGWLALAVYLLILGKIMFLGWRYARKRTIFSVASDDRTRNALRCAMVLLFSCLATGMESADFDVPLRSPFYLQNIYIAIILGISVGMIAASRNRHRGLSG
jgi:hypothetical protein